MKHLIQCFQLPYRSVWWWETTTSMCSSLTMLAIKWSILQCCFEILSELQHFARILLILAPQSVGTQNITVMALERWGLCIVHSVCPKTITMWLGEIKILPPLPVWSMWLVITSCTFYPMKNESLSIMFAWDQEHSKKLGLEFSKTKKPPNYYLTSNWKGNAPAFTFILQHWWCL